MKAIAVWNVIPVLHVYQWVANAAENTFKKHKWKQSPQSERWMKLKKYPSRQDLYYLPEAQNNR